MTSLIYVKFITTNELHSNDYEFWDWHYTITEAQLLTDALNQLICLNTECIMTLIDQKFLMKQASHMKIHLMTSFISVQELEVMIHQSAQYTKIDIFLPERDDCTAVTLWEIYIVEKLRIKMLININILMSEEIIIDLSRKIVIIESCDNVEILLIITIKLNTQIQHAVLAKQWIIILLWSNLTVTVLQSDLSCNYNFLFELNCCQINASVYVHIVDYAMLKVHV